MKTGEVLGVRYVLGGQVRKIGERISISITLSETEQGAVVWSGKFQRSLQEMLSLVDETAAKIAATISGRMEGSDIVAARRKPPENMTAFDCLLRGLDHHRLGVESAHGELTRRQLNGKRVPLRIGRASRRVQEDRAGAPIWRVVRERIVRHEDQLLPDLRVTETLAARVAGVRVGDVPVPPARPQFISDRRIDQLTPHTVQACQSSGLIGTHEARIADHIGREDSCKPPLQSFFSHMDRSAPVS